MKRKTTIIFYIFAIRFLAIYLDLPLFAMTLPEQVFAEGYVENRDGAVELKWKYADGALESGVLAGVRIYRLRDGDEMRYRVDPLILVGDVGSGNSLKVTGLGNDSRAIFVVRAFDESGKVVEELRLFGFPDTKPKDVPATYGAAIMATPTVRWAMSAVGDPLYKLKAQQSNRGTYGEI